MKKTSLLLFITYLFVQANTQLLRAQQRPNPDVPANAPANQPTPPPPVPQEDGPMRVLDAPPRAANAPRPDQPPSWKDRLRLGGSFALSLGTFTNIELSPAAGLQLTDRLAVGGSVVYRYINNRDFFTGQRFSDNFYGGRAFGFYNVFDNINLNVELETINVRYADVVSRVNRRTNLNSFLAGASYSTPTGGRFIRSASIVALYNFSYNQHVNPTTGNNIYPNVSPLVIRFLFF